MSILNITTIKSCLGNKTKKNQITKNRDIAIKIIDEFEKMLEKYNIKIPSENRKYCEDEACIYGTQYYDLEDTITEILDNKK